MSVQEHSEYCLLILAHLGVEGPVQEQDSEYCFLISLQDVDVAVDTNIKNRMYSKHIVVIYYYFIYCDIDIF